MEAVIRSTLCVHDYLKMLQGVQCHTGSAKWQLSCLWHGEKEGDMKLVVGSSSHGSVKLQVPSNHFNLMRERQSRVSGHCFPTWATGAGPIPRTVKEPASTWKVDNSRSFFVVVKIKSWSSPPTWVLPASLTTPVTRPASLARPARCRSSSSPPTRTQT